MANSTRMLGKQNDYNMDNLGSNDEWAMEENEANSTKDASVEEILVEVGEDEDASGVAAAPVEDFEVPPIANNDEGHGGDDINKHEDHVEEDDHPAFSENAFLG